MEYKYQNALLGGTFDHLHEGHKFFLRQAFLQAKNITIGITTHLLLKEKFHHIEIENLETRKNRLITFLKDEGFYERAKIIEISDIYGNSLTEKDTQVLFTSEEGIENAKLINIKRKEIGFLPLEIIMIPLIKSSDGKILSSTRIRSGETDNHGTIYSDIFIKNTQLLLPDNLREELKKPFGEILDFKNSEFLKRKFLIAIGDITVANLISVNFIPDICIFDLKTKREEIKDQKITTLLPEPSITLENKPGTINSRTALYLKSEITKCLTGNTKSAIQIDGEEDLLTLPSILFAPLNSLVIYGIVDVGACYVAATEQNKQIILDKFLKFFETSNRT